MNRLLLDTHVVLAMFDDRVASLGGQVAEAVESPGAASYASVASLWEIAIKTRLGKLVLKPDLAELPGILADLGTMVLTIEASHVLARIDPQPATRDPFDRLLLAQCLVENLRLVTLDRALAAHPLVWRPA